MNKDQKAASANKIYTRTGDKGQTSLIGGTRVSKSDPRLEAYGTVDELNSVLGVLRAELSSSSDSNLADADSFLAQIQNELFNVGSQLACEDKAMRTQLPSVHEESIQRLEEKMDEYSQTLAPLKNFILPGGTKAAAYAHVARTVCRRAERNCVLLSDTVDVLNRYLNRLSDYLFVLARHLNSVAKVSEPIWKS